MMTWWQTIIVLGTGMAGVLLAVFLGGWLVFRARSFSMPQPFLQTFTKESGDKPKSYVSDLYREPIDELLSEDLSPPAARLRDQKMSEQERVLAMVKGKK